jgi:hypothetical protein
MASEYGSLRPGKKVWSAIPKNLDWRRVSVADRVFQGEVAELVASVLSKSLNDSVWIRLEPLNNGFCAAATGTPTRCRCRR